MKTNLAKMFLITLLAFPSATLAARSECAKVGTRDIERRSLTSREIADGTISSADLGNNVVTGNQITEFITVHPFVLAAGESRELVDTGDLRVEANCYNYDGYDTATVNIWNITDGASLFGADPATVRVGSSTVSNAAFSDEQTNLTSAVGATNREMHRAAATIGNPGIDYATRSSVVGADGALLRSRLHVGVNLRSIPGCHFGGLIHYTPAP
jgi:hypothetical protein